MEYNLRTLSRTPSGVPFGKTCLVLLPPPHHHREGLNDQCSGFRYALISALSHKKFRVDAPHSMGRYKEETGGLLSQVEDF